MAKAMFAELANSLTIAASVKGSPWPPKSGSAASQRVRYNSAKSSISEIGGLLLRPVAVASEDRNAKSYFHCASRA